jgi:hypothetical protein
MHTSLHTFLTMKRIIAANDGNKPITKKARAAYFLAKMQVTECTHVATVVAAARQCKTILQDPDHKHFISNVIMKVKQWLHLDTIADSSLANEGVLTKQSCLGKYASLAKLCTTCQSTIHRLMLSTFMSWPFSNMASKKNVHAASHAISNNDHAMRRLRETFWLVRRADATSHTMHMHTHAKHNNAGIGKLISNDIMRNKPRTIHVHPL